MDGLLERIDWTAEWLAQTRPRSREPLRVGTSIVDRGTGEVRTPGSCERLRRKELQLLEYLHSKACATCSRGELLEQVWRCHPGVSTRTVDQTVATLRRKLGDNSDSPELLLTVFGVGYRLNPDLPVS